ncbi:MAG: capreomycidine synthase [Acidobacteria bacterium]|nr:capreomycidine synthase [Acidobacteriota bacterium]
MRDYYFETDYDIGSSGVENYSMTDLYELTGLRREDLDAVVFHDSMTLGGDAARQALADRFAGGDVSRVMVTHGSTEANFLINAGLLEAGDEVLVLDPFYQQLYAVAEALGCRLKRWPMRWEDGFQPRMEDLDDLLTPDTKMVVVNFPHNPTGATIAADEQAELIRRCDQVGAYLVWDGAFSELVYDTPMLPEPPLVYERALSMGTFSKAYGLPGLRVGWCIAAPEVLEKFVRLRDYTLLHLSPLVELIFQKALEAGDVLVGKRLEQARGNRALLDGWIRAHSDFIEWALPAGGVTGFPRFKNGLDVEAFCHRLAQEKRVLLVPGSCFGFPEHARLGFGGSTAELEAGLDAIASLLG